MKKIFSITIAIFSCGALSLSFNNSGTDKSTTGSKSQMSFDSTAAKKAVEAGNKLFMESVAKGDSVTAANCYTADAKFMGANTSAISGRKNILAAFSGFIKADVTKIGLTTTSVWGSNDLLAEEGLFTVATKNGHQVNKGKYIHLWKKEDGKWKIFRDCSNSDLPVPSSK